MSEGNTQLENDYIRPIQEKDEKIIKMLIGQGVMEGLARANNKFIIHPIVVFVIVALGMTLNRIMSFQSNSLNIFSWLTILIGPCLVALPILGIVEYLHRPMFTSLLRRTIGSEDLIQLREYYSSPDSNIKNTAKDSKNDSKGWVFIHNNEIIGVILVDTQNPGRELNSVLGDEEGEISQDRYLLGKVKGKKYSNSENDKIRNRKSTDPKSTSALNDTDKLKGIIQIRHFEVDSPYRKSIVPNELSVQAIEHHFSPSSSSSIPTKGDGVDRIIIKMKPFSNYLGSPLAQIGFKVLSAQDQERMGLEKPNSIGLFKWQEYYMILNKDDWVKDR